VQSLRWEFGRASIAFLSFLSDLVCFVFGDKYFSPLQALGLAFIFPLFLCFSCNSFFLRCLMDKDSECNALILRVPTSLIKETLSGFVEQVSTLNIPVFQSYNARYFGKLQ
jgi:hypothetical protein